MPVMESVKIQACTLFACTDNSSVPMPPNPPCLPIGSQVTATRSPSKLSYSVKSDEQRRMTWDHTPSGLCASIVKRLQRNEDNLKCLYEHYQIEPVLQDGPMCGIVAVCMAGQMLKPSQLIYPIDVLNKAQMNGASKQGEMFSALHMAQLCEDVLHRSAKLFNGSDCSLAEVLIKALLNGNPVLIPYDKDGNNEPCCKRGQKAHWALLSGFAVIGTPSELESVVGKNFDFSSDVAKIEDQKLSLPSLKMRSDYISNIYVFANQGKSRYTGIWNLQSLLLSNRNLVELDSNIAADIDNYEVHSGIEKGLNNQLIVITNL